GGEHQRHSLPRRVVAGPGASPSASEAPVRLATPLSQAPAPAAHRLLLPDAGHAVFNPALPSPGAWGARFDPAAGQRAAARDPGHCIRAGRTLERPDDAGPDRRPGGLLLRPDADLLTRVAPAADDPAAPGQAEGVTRQRRLL